MDEINLKTVEDLLKSGSLQLGAIQNEICLPILQRIYKKMKLGIEFDNIRVRDSRMGNSFSTSARISLRCVHIPLNTINWTANPEAMLQAGVVG